MKRYLKFILLLVIYNAHSLFVFSQNCTLYEIEPEHLDGESIEKVNEDWASSGIRNVFPWHITPDRQIDVTDYDVLPDMDDQLDNPCGQQLIDLIKNLDPKPDIDNPVMLYFPPGAYLIDKPIVLTGYIVLKGAGGAADLPKQTHLHFDLSNDYDNICITLSGGYNGIEDLLIIDDTECPESVKVNFVPSTVSSQNHQLIYNVEGAKYMHTTIDSLSSGDGIVLSDTGIYYFQKNPVQGKIYNVLTIFSNETDSVIIQHKVVFLDNKNKIKNSINDFKDSINTTKSKCSCDEDSYYKSTIHISDSNNWIRGVESIQTRRFHVKIDGYSLHNTVSGSYFHLSRCYTDDHGRGYGVIVEKYSKYNRIENNVFYYLRHAMALQGDAYKNVIAYNYSTEVHATGGNPLHKEADLLLHGHTGTTIGPKLNLLEGNYVVRSRVDTVHIVNGPYNTFFRIYTSDDFFKITWVKKKLRKKQYAQNVIGCNMNPRGNTLSRIDNYGFRDYYPEYSSIPDEYCSLYLDEKPDFYPTWINWPFYPGSGNIIPAKYRWDSHHGYYDPVPIPVFQGWDDYPELCGPPNYKFNNEQWLNDNEQYFAMHKIFIENSEMVSGNNLLFYANNVILKQGTVISSNNNDVIIKSGNPCNNKNYNYLNTSNNSYDSKVDTANQLTKNSGYKSKPKTEAISKNILIYPNPNNGSFFIKSCFIIKKSEIKIYDVLGNRLDFEVNPHSNNNLNIRLKKSTDGIIIVHIHTKDIFKIKKLVINNR